jgi:glutamine cyclotransferase
MKAVFFSFCVAAAMLIAVCRAGGAAQELNASKDCKRLDIKVAGQVSVPRCYHEGLYYDGKALWLSNGEGGNTWVVDVETGAVLSEIKGVADFTEAVTARGDGTFYTTEWYAKSVYRVRLEGGAFVVDSSVCVEPSHPAGAIWNGKRLYVVAWDRGIWGTKFSLLEMDDSMSVIRKVPIRAMQEPCQLAWDGKYLWMSSWYDRRVYKVDVERMEAIGYFCSPVERTTGIAWDGKYLWLTATHGDLYKIEILTK